MSPDQKSAYGMLFIEQFGHRALNNSSSYRTRFLVVLPTGNRKSLHMSTCWCPLSFDLIVNRERSVIAPS